MRLENLGILDWDIWAWGGRDASDVIDEEHDATVLDLGAFREPGEFKAAALSVLDHLWQNREQRRPRLIVIDEAHNLCSPDPQTPADRLLTERIVQIAAEGRKFGLWLVLSTQRPSKVHPNALSQCDNVALMRMNAPNDLAALAESFGFVPQDLLMRSPVFGQGQAIFAGGFTAARSWCRWARASRSRAARTSRCRSGNGIRSGSGIRSGRDTGSLPLEQPPHGPAREHQHDDERGQ